MRKITLLGVILSFVACALAFAKEKERLIIFFSPTCRHCLQVNSQIVPQMEKEYGDRVNFELRDISDVENYKLLLNLRQAHKSDLEIEVPIFFFKGQFAYGKNNPEQSLRQLLSTQSHASPQGDRIIQADYARLFHRFSFAGIVLAALEDGVNPCAFTVIVFFISYLALQGYRKRELFAIGISFIAAVFLTYLLIGLGIFNFLYRIKGFWFISRALNVSVGALSIALGLLAFYDFLKYSKTKDTDAQILQLPLSVKNKIHAVIGLHYRKGKAQDAAPSISKLILSALSCGFLVTLLEAVCTGQLYLPTIVLILKTTQFKAQAFGYLLIYNILFITPLLVILSFAVLGVSSSQFSAFLKKHLGALKIMMCLLFLALGAFLIWKG